MTGVGAPEEERAGPLLQPGRPAGAHSTPPRVDRRRRLWAVNGVQEMGGRGRLGMSEEETPEHHSLILMEGPGLTPSVPGARWCPPEAQ